MNDAYKDAWDEMEKTGKLEGNDPPEGWKDNEEKKEEKKEVKKDEKVNE